MAGDTLSMASIVAAAVAAVVAAVGMVQVPAAAYRDIEGLGGIVKTIPFGNRLGKCHSFVYLDCCNRRVNHLFYLF